jgi:serine/threonine protein kinase
VGDNILKTFKKILHDEPPLITDNTYSSEFQKTVVRLLKREPSKRGTAEELKKSLMKRLKTIRSNSNDNEDENVIDYDITYPSSILENYKKALEEEGEGEESNK